MKKKKVISFVYDGGMKITRCDVVTSKSIVDTKHNRKKRNLSKSRAVNAQ